MELIINQPIITSIIIQMYSMMIVVKSKYKQPTYKNSSFINKNLNL